MTDGLRAWLRDPWLGAIVAVSLALKLALALSIGPVTPRNDENDYLRRAREIAAHHEYPDAFRPPLYPAFMALVFEAGGDIGAVRVAQVALSVVSTVLVFVVVSALWTVGAARIGALLVGFDPVQIAFSHLLWSETLYVFLLLFAVYLFVQGATRENRSYWFLGGVVCGLAGLTRPQILTFLPLVLAWMACEHRHRCVSGGQRPAGWRAALRPFGFLFAGCMLVLLPWSVRNLVKSGSFIAVDTNGAFNILVGNEPSAWFVDKDDVWDSAWGAIDGEPYRTVASSDAGRAQRRAVEIALKNIANDPLRFIQKAVWEAGHLWTLDSFLLRHLRNGWYGGSPSTGLVAVVTMGATAYAMFIVVAGLAAGFCLPGGALRRLYSLFLMHATVVAGLTYSLSRYAVPLRPFLCMGAAYAVTWGLVTGRPWGSPLARRRVVGLLLLVALGLVWYRDLPLVLDMLTSGGEHYRFELVRK